MSLKHDLGEKIDFKKMHTFRGYIKIGMISNLLFVLFIILTMAYYKLYLKTGIVSVIIEAIAYGLEFLGFMCMIASALGLIARLRQRILLKTAMVVYFIVEAAIMVFDLNVINVDTFYTPSSKILVVLHCVFSAAVCLTYMQLETKKTCIQVAVAIASTIMLLAIFVIVGNTRVYASVLINSIAYIVLFGLILFFDKQEMIWVDCYGDIAPVYEDGKKTESTIFTENSPKADAKSEKKNSEVPKKVE